MDWNCYKLLYINSYDGEDEMGKDVSGRSVYTCPVADLKEGEEVVWDRPIHGYPAVKCKAIGENEITLLYTNYMNPDDRLSVTREVTLSPAKPTWGHCLGGGRYDHSYDLHLVVKE